MEGLGRGEIVGVRRVVDYLGDLVKSGRRLTKDLRYLHGQQAAASAVSAIGELDETVQDLQRALSTKAHSKKVGGYLVLVRQQSKKVALALDDAASHRLPAAQQVMAAKFERLVEALNELPEEIAPHVSVLEDAPFDDDVLLLSTSVQPAELDDSRLRALLAKRDSVLIIDGDQVAASGWPELSVINRRFSLLALLGLVERRADIDVVFDFRVAGREAAMVADGLQVLLTSANVAPSDAVLSLIVTQPLDTPILVVSDDRELLESTAQVQRSVMSTSCASLLRLLSDVDEQPSTGRS